MQAPPEILFKHPDVFFENTDQRTILVSGCELCKKLKKDCLCATPEITTTTLFSGKGLHNKLYQMVLDSLNGISVPVPVVQPVAEINNGPDVNTSAEQTEEEFFREIIHETSAFLKITPDGDAMKFILDGWDVTSKEADELIKEIKELLPIKASRITPDRYALFPASLKPEPVWLVYKMEWDAAKGKNDKIPYNPITGWKANDPELGVTFDVAASKSEQFSGVGIYVESPYIVIDIDNCRDSKTGLVEEWVMEIIRELDTYAEASPSGTGVHIWLKGVKPGAACRNGIEIYSSGRFMTVTGNQIQDTPSSVNERDIASVYSRMVAGEFQDSAKSTNPIGTPAVGDKKTGVVVNQTGSTITTKLNLLMCGKIVSKKPFVVEDGFGNSLKYESQSEADLSLATGLALRNPDTTVIDEEFRKSSLFRDKWDRKDYRDDTIQKAIKTAADLKKRANESTNASEKTSEIPITDDPDENDTQFEMVGDKFDTKIYEDMAQHSTAYPNPGEGDLISLTAGRLVHGTNIPLAYVREPLKAIVLHALDGKLIHPAFPKLSLRGNYFSLGESESGKTTGLEFALEAGKIILKCANIHQENLFRYKSETVFIRSFTPEGTIKRDANGAVKSGHAGHASQFLYIKEGNLVANCSDYFSVVFSQLTNLYDQTEAGTESMTNGDFSAGVIKVSTVMCFTPTDYISTFGGKGTIGGGGLNRWAVTNPPENHDYDDKDWERLEETVIQAAIHDLTVRVTEVLRGERITLVEEPGARAIRLEVKAMLKKAGKIGKRLLDYFMREQVAQAAMAAVVDDALKGQMVMTAGQAAYARTWIEAQLHTRVTAWPSDSKNQIEGMEHAIRKRVDTHFVSEKKLKDVCHFYREGSGGWFIYSTALKNSLDSGTIKLTGKTRKGMKTFCPGSCAIHSAVEPEEKPKKK
jgi:putative DNA primase/helicase